MGKLNEGDVMEGIFALALAELFAYGKISKKNINKHRAKIEPEMFKDGKYTCYIRDEMGGGKGFKTKSFPPDIFIVELQLRLKPASVEGAYGKKYNVLFESSKDIGSIDKKINSMIKSADRFSAQLLKIRDKFLNNNKADKVKFVIEADGIEGESSGGRIKADIVLRIYGNGKQLKRGTYNYSLKSGSKTLANLSPFKGLTEMMKRFGLTYKYEGQYASALGPGGSLNRVRTPDARKKKVDMLQNMYDEFIEDMRDEGGNSKFTRSAFEVFRDAAFGSDLATVVDLNKNSVKGMSPQYMNELEDSAIINGKYLKASIRGVAPKRILAVHWDENKPENDLFTFRNKFRTRSSGGLELKFYVEAGKMAYSKYY
jgi:hypothetical protein